ncbi:hypothetical protein CAEBREN_25069 [Caenorhabditis brenneri]|uniref:DUF38 domain-containing protein n=1 Tax=Caenorhabditis brenneri TaxID=135651 RepID=G0N305_CAEBE|nr:hypothetical protein CAEBREN_25069 [Caenorhabditis brenneri]
MELDQWKQAEELNLMYSLHWFPDEVLVQFKEYWIQTCTLDKAQFARIGMKFATSPVFESCRLVAEEPSREIDFMDSIGVPGPPEEDYRSIRHLMIPNTDKLLVFKEYAPGDIEIEKQTRDIQ